VVLLPLLVVVIVEERDLATRSIADVHGEEM